MRRIFISHRNVEADTVTLISEISADLRAAGHDVLVDFERLKPGATWRDEIYTWLGVCHAGVVLVSPAALAEDSVWVPRECSILSWRKALDPSFTLLPVLLPGVTTDQLRGDLRYRDLGLHDLQVITHEDHARTREAIVDAVARLAATPRTPLEDLAEQIEALIVQVRQEYLEEAIALAGWNAAVLPSFGGTARQLSLALLQVPLARAIEALEYLSLRMPQAASVDRIVDILAPGWVDLSAARWVACCSAASSPRPAVVLNANSRFAAEMYVRRASCRPPRTTWRVVAITGVHGEAAFEDLATEIIQALLVEFATCFFQDDSANTPESQLAGLVQELNRRGRPVVVVFRLPAGIVELMPRLQERFPFLTFLFLSGDSLPDEDACPVTLLRRLLPALSEGQERAAMTDYQTARSILRAGV